MHAKTSLTTAAWVVAAMATMSSASALAKDLASPATPTGVTLQSVTLPLPVGAPQGVLPERLVVYGNERGLTLYTSDEDVVANKSACTGDCVKTYPPMLAGKDAKSFDKWMVISRDDGAKQWAFNGKPLYTYVKDMAPGYLGGNKSKGQGGGASGEKTAEKPQEMPKGWQSALLKPAAGMTFPSAINLREVPALFGQALVDQGGMTIYAFDGDAKNDKQTCILNTVSCGDHWVPVSAPQLANNIGDFSVVARRDGSKQWAYKNHPLYTFSGDVVPGETHGVGQAKSWDAAVLVRYFTPPNVSTLSTVNFGSALTTAKGMSLYRRDTKGLVTSGHLLPSFLVGNPATGRVIGTAGCDTECLKTWRPFVAPAEAISTGYWDVVAGANGTKQWAYKGFALYTYSEDKKPGDIIGQDIYDIVIGEDEGNASYKEISAKMEALIPNYAISMFWTYAAP